MCEWEAVKHLPLLCNGSFYGWYGGYGYLPDTPSNNIWPDCSNNTNGPRDASQGTVKWSETNLYFNSTQWDHCNVHAFCWTCADPDGSLNEYCEAALQRYDWWHTQSNAGTAGHTPSPAKHDGLRQPDRVLVHGPRARRDRDGALQGALAQRHPVAPAHMLAP